MYWLESCNVTDAFKFRGREGFALRRVLGHWTEDEGPHPITESS